MLSKSTSHLLSSIVKGYSTITHCNKSQDRVAGEEEEEQNIRPPEKKHLYNCIPEECANATEKSE